MSEIAGPLIQWLLTEGPRQPDYRAVLSQLRDRLVAAGVQLGRCGGSIPILHPEWIATRYDWREGQRGFREEYVLHGTDRTDMFRNSPVEALRNGAPLIRRRLAGPDAALDFPMMTELAEQGFTDYLALPMHQSDGRMGLFTVCTKAEIGFSDAEIDVLRAILPALSVVAELHSMRNVTRSLLDTYIGHGAGERILTGQVRRGHGETVRTVLWYTDLRGFTAMSDRLPRDALIHALNDYFETLAGPVQSLGGEVVKFIGDAMLAIFRIEEGGDARQACETALTAAEVGMQRMRSRNRRRAGEDMAELRYGLALHVGDVMFGNVGAERRLDFTVTGAAVNLVARLEKLTADLDLTFVASADFAALCPRPLRLLGRHALKGLAEPQEVFTLP
jgi:adenylate cyclase